jgi:hypothetical protein
MSEQKITFAHVPEMLLRPVVDHDSAKTVGVVTQQMMTDLMSYGMTQHLTGGKLANPQMFCHPIHKNIGNPE